MRIFFVQEGADSSNRAEKPWRSLRIVAGSITREKRVMDPVIASITRVLSEGLQVGAKSTPVGPRDRLCWPNGCLNRGLDGPKSAKSSGKTIVRQMLTASWTQDWSQVELVKTGSPQQFRVSVSGKDQKV